VDDNAVVSINLKWFGQILILVGTLVYGYYRIETRLGILETNFANADERIGSLLDKHIVEERAEREELAEKVAWYEKNINPLSWGKRRKEIMDFMAVYGEAGMIGVVGIMFMYLVISLSKQSTAQQESLKNLEIENKGQSESINNMEGMIIKLISRWNESDSVRDRRYEQMMEAVSDLEKQLSRMDGIMSRMNGNGRG